MKDEKIGKPLNIAMIGGGRMLCKKVQLIHQQRRRVEENVNKSHIARNVIWGGGVFLCTKSCKTYLLAAEATWKEMQGNLIMHEM